MNGWAQTEPMILIVPALVAILAIVAVGLFRRRRRRMSERDSRLVVPIRQPARWTQRQEAGDQSAPSTTTSTHPAVAADLSEQPSNARVFVAKAFSVFIVLLGILAAAAIIWTAPR